MERRTRHYLSRACLFKYPLINYIYWVAVCAIQDPLSVILFVHVTNHSNVLNLQQPYLNNTILCCMKAQGNDIDRNQELCLVSVQYSCSHAVDNLTKLWILNPIFLSKIFHFHDNKPVQHFVHRYRSWTSQLPYYCTVGEKSIKNQTDSKISPTQ